MSNNKLLCTFVEKEDIENQLSALSHLYKIKNDKIFILDIEGSKEVILTYGADVFNLNTIPKNTIFVHRKQQSNTLFTINALNKLIYKITGSYNPSHEIDWSSYSNSVLLTRGEDLNILNTKLNKIHTIK
jgi:hypothetical protein